MAVPKSEFERRMEQFHRTCRQSGMKVTRQRTEVYRALAATDVHPDAETVYRAVSRRIPAISRDTVYRALATLEDHGLLRRAETYCGAARYDANVTQHHHFVCTRCGRVSDFVSSTLDRLPLPRSLAALGDVESAHVQALGVCRACRGRKGNRRKQ